MGWRCSCQLSMTLMQLTVDVRCVCGAASHVVTALKRLASAVEVSGRLGGAVAEGVETVWRDDRVIVSSFHR
jgi:hypothetical protein